MWPCRSILPACTAEQLPKVGQSPLPYTAMSDHAFGTKFESSYLKFNPMKFSALLFMIVFFIGSAATIAPHAAAFKSNEKKPKRDVELKKVTKSIQGEYLLLKLKVKANIDLMSYPRAVAMLNGKEISDPEDLDYYAHSTGSTMVYSISLPASYKGSVRKMKFKIVDGGEEYPL